MSKDIIVKKGLNINLVGDATKTLDISKNSKYYSVYPEDFHGVFPKLTIKVDEKMNPEVATILIKLLGDVTFLIHVRDNGGN